MHDQDAVLAGVYRALRPGGRFVAELGGHGNIAAIRAALRALTARFGLEAEDAGSNTFFTADEYAAMLQRHGFAVEYVALVPRPTFLPTGMRAWIETFRRSLLDRLDQDNREAVLSESVDLLRPILCDRAGNWWADYVRLRFRASKR
jgi:SAM-dependent methyltransferase